jgi:Ca2+-binding RTX toxin-like protein
VYDFYVQVSPEASAQSRLAVDGGAGSDSISVSSNVPLRTNLSGGSGSDKLTSGKKIANLYGGGGNDILISRSTKGGTLDGGKGSDRYYNRAAASGTTTSEIRVLARRDGDRLMLASGAVPIVRSGLFGASTIDRDSYYLVDGSAGQVDLLAAR